MAARGLRQPRRRGGRGPARAPAHRRRAHQPRHRLPGAARELAQRAAPYGIEVIDAPVAGGRTVALARQLTTVAGGR
ncbi:NAD(P)-binding domain-containing protein [Rugosimonospora acidiphila]|uniref:NAD(P)-binding domain-containing protein n=1 Tax=Rugosimonospora acidiphila TaxID=556531 RepID=UPI003CD07360